MRWTTYTFVRAVVMTASTMTRTPAGVLVIFWVYTPALVMQNLIQKKLQLLQPSKLKMWWKMKQNLPISSSFKKDLPHLKCFIKIFPQKILPWKNESISCTNLLFLKKWIFSCFMSNLKEKKLETKQKKLSKVAKIISCYKNDTMCTTILNEKKKNRSSAHKKNCFVHKLEKK